MDEGGPVTTWPPEGEDAQLLAALAGVIERGGAGRFLDTRLVAADEDDFPEPWRPTRAALERLIARILWHAYVDLDVEVEDLRADADRGTDMLHQTTLEWLANEDGAAVFHLEKIGNDDVAGLLAHEIGRAFLAWVTPVDPYRNEPYEPSPLDGSVAAIYLGLGVLAVNSAARGRFAHAVHGNAVAWERDVVIRGGLTTRAAAYLLAVQAVARDHEAPALATLADRPRAAVRDMIAVLRPHRAALLQRLALDLAAPRPALERDPSPATVTDASRPEPHGLINVGRPVFRVPQYRTIPGGAAGTAAGFVLVATLFNLGIVANANLLLALVVVTGTTGAVLGRRIRVDECASCQRLIPAASATCPGCGGTIRGIIKHANERLAREDELEG